MDPAFHIADAGKSLAESLWSRHCKDGTAGIVMCLRDLELRLARGCSKTLAAIALERIDQLAVDKDAASKCIGGVGLH